MNSYSYSRNNPITLSDPEGEFVQFIAAFLARQTLGSVVRGLLSGATDILAGIDVYEGFVTNFDADSTGKLIFDTATEVIEQNVNKYQKALVRVADIVVEVLGDHVKIEVSPTNSNQTNSQKNNQQSSNNDNKKQNNENNP